MLESPRPEEKGHVNHSTERTALLGSQLYLIDVFLQTTCTQQRVKSAHSQVMANPMGRIIASLALTSSVGKSL